MNNPKKTVNWVYELTKIVPVCNINACRRSWGIDFCWVNWQWFGSGWVYILYPSFALHPTFYHCSFLSLLFISLFLVKLEPWAVICLFTLHVLPVVGCWCILCCCHLTTLMFCEHVILQTPGLLLRGLHNFALIVALKLLMKNVYTLYTCCSGFYFVPILLWDCWDISIVSDFSAKKSLFSRVYQKLDTTVETRCSHLWIW